MDDVIESMLAGRGDLGLTEAEEPSTRHGGFLGLFVIMRSGRDEWGIAGLLLVAGQGVVC